MQRSIIDDLLQGSDDEAGAGGEAEDVSDDASDDGEGEVSDEEDEEEGSEGEEESEEEEDEEAAAAAGAAAVAAASADPFSRKQLQKAAAGAAAAAPGGDAPQQQPGRAPPEAGATVFIRGLPLDVSKEQVFLKMKVGGRVGWCVGGRFVCGAWSGGGWGLTGAVGSCCSGTGDPVLLRLPGLPMSRAHSQRPLLPMLCRCLAPCAPAAWWWTRTPPSLRAPLSWTSTGWHLRRQPQRRAPRPGGCLNKANGVVGLWFRGAGGEAWRLHGWPACPPVSLIMLPVSPGQLNLTCLPTSPLSPMQAQGGPWRGDWRAGDRCGPGTGA